MNIRKPPPPGKHIFGTVRVGDKGQIVIPKKTREIFHIQPGDELIVLGDEGQGLTLMKNEAVLQAVTEIKRRMPPEAPQEEET